MARETGTDRSGGGFGGDVKLAVWKKGKPGSDPARTRYDICGFTIKWDQYGETTKTGWEIDHIMPVALGGTDDIYNLQPLQWENNRKKGDSDFGEWKCPEVAK